MTRILRALNIPALAATIVFCWAVIALAVALEPFATTGAG